MSFSSIPSFLPIPAPQPTLLVPEIILSQWFSIYGLHVHFYHRMNLFYWLGQAIDYDPISLPFVVVVVVFLLMMTFFINLGCLALFLLNNESNLSMTSISFSTWPNLSDHLSASFIFLGINFLTPEAFLTSCCVRPVCPLDPSPAVPLTCPAALCPCSPPLLPPVLGVPIPGPLFCLGPGCSGVVSWEKLYRKQVLYGKIFLSHSLPHSFKKPSSSQVDREGYVEEHLRVLKGAAPLSSNFHVLL